ncbi:MAG: iron-siderophore ABC transporter substrate-binding protein [Caldilineaceae bacterium]|nr:iron-siderophore ABC transporter substrate-binding protein [Caldilineaceae bacterium]
MKPKLLSLFIYLLSLVFLAACALPVAPASAPATSEATSAARVIQHALGETTITGTPQRVVALEWIYAEDLLALGIQPVGVADIAGYNNWVKIPLALGPDVADVGTRNEPNLELLATLQPDLILGPLSRIDDAKYAALSALAPTLVFNHYPADQTSNQYMGMIENFRLVADVVGRQTEGEAVIAQLETKFTNARALLEANGKLGEKFTLAQGYTSNNTATIRLFVENALAINIIEQIGLALGWNSGWQEFGFSTVSVETLPELGDLHFFYVVQDDDNIFASEAVTPLWENLEFVKNGHAYPLGGGTWLFGGPLSAEVLVDIVLKALVPDAVSNASPTPTAFPVTIEHKYGSTPIAAKPTRIVTVGLTDHDAVLALGVVPLGVTEWLGAYPSAIGPWAQPLLGNASLPEVVGDPSAPNFEKIAALQPDLILALYSGITQEQYDLLSQIAPTVAQPADYVDYGIPWQALTLTVGRALGESAQAEALIAAVTAQFAQAQVEHPEFGGAVGLVAAPTDGGFGVYAAADPRSRVLTDLGFVRPAAIDELVGDSFWAALSLEQIHLIDVDLLEWAWGTPGEGVLGEAVYTNLAVYQEGRVLNVGEMDDDTGTAFSFITVLSLPYLLERLVPQIAAAVDGDPATVAAPPTP